MDNIRKFVKGGSGEYSCRWMYLKQLNLKLATNIDQEKYEHAGNIQDNALCYLNSIPDYQQYPAAKCALGEGFCMFQRTASSSVESRNHANQAVRERTAVDPVNAIILLLQ